MARVDQASLFRDIDRGGASIETPPCPRNGIVKVPDIRAKHGPAWNDQVGSLECGPEIFLVLFANRDFSGHAAIHIPGQTIRNLGRDQMNNSAGSYIVVGIDNRNALLDFVST